jgi:hypothetical protein
MHIYKLVFDTEQQGKQVLIDNNVWQEVTEEGVTKMQYINGTKGVVYIGKVINPQATTDPEHPIYYPGYAYDVMSTDELDLEQYRVYPNGSAAHQFYGYKRGDDT